MRTFSTDAIYAAAKDAYGNSQATEATSRACGIRAEQQRLVPLRYMGFQQLCARPIVMSEPMKSSSVSGKNVIEYT